MEANRPRGGILGCQTRARSMRPHPQRRRRSRSQGFKGTGGCKAQHPGLRIHLDASDRIVNLVDEGFDMAIRFGPMSDSGPIARAIGRNAYVMCASPAYLDRRGRVLRGATGRRRQDQWAG